MKEDTLKKTATDDITAFIFNAQDKTALWEDGLAVVWVRKGTQFLFGVMRIFPNELCWCMITETHILNFM